jgi:hypothetical protein
VRVSFVITRNGKEIRTVVESNPVANSTTTSIGVKVD